MFLKAAYPVLCYAPVPWHWMPGGLTTQAMCSSCCAQASEAVYKLAPMLSTQCFMWTSHVCAHLKHDIQWCEWLVTVIMAQVLLRASGTDDKLHLCTRLQQGACLNGSTINLHLPSPACTLDACTQSKQAVFSPVLQQWDMRICIGYPTCAAHFCKVREQEGKQLICPALHAIWDTALVGLHKVLGCRAWVKTLASHSRRLVAAQARGCMP